MAIFPEGKLLKNGFKRGRIPSVVRSDPDFGPAKQRLKSYTSYIRFPVEYFFTAEEYAIFDEWAKDTIKFVGSFDWIEPVSLETLVVRIVSGDISNAQPFNQEMSHWIVKFTIETTNPNNL